METNGNVSELKDSVGEVLDAITPEMCRQVMLSPRRRLQLCAQTGGQQFEHGGVVAALWFRQRGTPPDFLLACCVPECWLPGSWCIITSEMMASHARLSPQNGHLGEDC